MITEELLKIMCCPETHQQLFLADKMFIEKLNDAIKKGKIKNRGGKVVSNEIQSALIREDKKYLYPVINDIPIMLIEEAIPICDDI
ncbi:MAG: Trm112 family protein [Verrucomicrobiia bacterium]|jgi:uncharacterized protein YbaR (Trm112 family)